MVDLSPPWAEAVAQGRLPQRCWVNVKPVGRLANPDLPSFEVALSTSHSVAKSASRLIESVMQRLNIQTQPLFSVSIAGKQVAFIVRAMLEDFMEEMQHKLTQSLFEESDAVTGHFTTFCDLTEAGWQAAAAGQAAVDGSQPALPKERKP